MMNYFLIDGKPSLDFGLVISGAGTYASPQKRYEEVDIPGRNGKLLLNTDTFFDNVEVTYDSFLYENLVAPSKVEYVNPYDRRTLNQKLSNLRSFLGSRKGYFKLEDTYHPDEFRLGYYAGGEEVEVDPGFRYIQMTLSFMCKPQRFLKEGENPVDFTSSGTISNYTSFDAKPLIRAYGTGSFTLNGTTVRINSTDYYMDIDCDLMECYKDSTNCNGNVTLTAGKFPVIAPGDNKITLNGISKLTITPRWWVL